MRQFLLGGYKAIIFQKGDVPVAYGLYTQHLDHDDTIYLRQIFVDRAFRRQGIGREVMRVLREDVLPRNKRVTVGVLFGNEAAKLFYDAVGFKPYSLELELPALE
jgi:ribosomal protein S18 acetylase RimI-like enzyme